MTSQKELFTLDEGINYLNCAAYSPLMKSVVEAGVTGILLKTKPYSITSDLFFSGAEVVRKLFAELIQTTETERIAVLSSVSYGMAVVANNLHRLPNLSSKKHIILLQEEFPNNVYAFERVCQTLNLTAKTIEIDVEMENRGKIWNESILAAITNETAMVVMPHVHWIYGVKFNLVEISKKCKSVGALLVIDGTQSVGALPFDVEEIQPDALICAGYKWLMGSYSIGLGYFSEFFDEGIPVEESWMNRQDSDKFAQLIRYERAYRPKAQRYNSGEFSQFIQMPMLETALRQLLDWSIPAIQNYCKTLIIKPLAALEQEGCRIESEEFRANHLFGIILPERVNNALLLEQLATKKIFVSHRGKAIRVSPHVYNEEADLWALVEALKAVI